MDRANPGMKYPVTLDANHLYWTPDGVNHPGFSEVCGAMGVTAPNPFYTVAGRERGVAVHQWGSFLARGGVAAAPPDERISARVDRVKEFLSRSGFKMVGTEVPLYDPALNFCCTEDLYGYIGHFSCVIDLKTGGKMKVAMLQTAAQKIALSANGFRAQKRFGLYVRDKNYRLVEHADFRDEMKFRAIIIGYHALTPEQRAAFRGEDAMNNALIKNLNKKTWSIALSAYNAKKFYL